MLGAPSFSNNAAYEAVALKEDIARMKEEQVELEKKYEEVKVAQEDQKVCFLSPF